MSQPWGPPPGQPGQPSYGQQPAYGQPPYGQGLYGDPHASRPQPPAPVGALHYHQLHRLGHNSWWRGLLGVFLVVASLLVLVQLVLVIAFAIVFALAGHDVTQGISRAVDTTNVTPTSLAFLNLGLAAAIPTTWIAQRLLHGLPPRWLASVRPRIRWRFMGACFGAAIVTLVVTVVVSSLLPASGSEDVGSTLNPWTSQTLDFVLVIVLLTPLQAAGEEYAFRGYLTQAIGGLPLPPKVSAVTAVLVPSVLFGLAHGLGQGLPIFVDRTSFGIVAGVLVILTGGLEAGIAMHVLNNFLAFGLALAFGDMSSTLNASGGSWWQLGSTLTQSFVYLGLVLLLARWMGVERLARPPVGPGLVAPERRV